MDTGADSLMDSLNETVDMLAWVSLGRRRFEIAAAANAEHAPGSPSTAQQPSSPAAPPTRESTPWPETGGSLAGLDAVCQLVSRLLAALGVPTIMRASRPPSR